MQLNTYLINRHTERAINPSSQAKASQINPARRQLDAEAIESGRAAVLCMLDGAVHEAWLHVDSYSYSHLLARLDVKTAELGAKVCLYSPTVVVAAKDMYASLHELCLKGAKLEFQFVGIDLGFGEGKLVGEAVGSHTRAPFLSCVSLISFRFPHNDCKFVGRRRVDESSLNVG